MQRERSEIISYTKDDLERIVRHLAQMQIVGHLFIGKMGEQQVVWNGSTGGVDVITKYVEGTWEDLPQVDPLALSDSSKKKGKKK
jgi:hypothetical protein